MQKRPLKTSQHYIRFSVDPPCADAITVRKALQDAVLQSFGLTSANVYADILWLAKDGREAVVRLDDSEAMKVMAAVTAFTGSPHLSLLKESSFLPALLADNKFP